MENNYQGAFLRSEEKERADRRPVAEGVDDDLAAVLGEHYQDKTVVDVRSEPEEGQTGEKGGWKQFRAICGLVAGVGLLLYMVVTGKIDTAYGVIFTAGVSAACGYRMQ